VSADGRERVVIFFPRMIHARGGLIARSAHTAFNSEGKAINTDERGDDESK
jgi:hypothetical protein